VDAGHMQAVVDSLRRSGGNGALAVFLGARTGIALEGVAPLRRSFTHFTLVAFDAAPGSVAAGQTLVVDADHPFRDVWSAAMLRRRSGVVAR
jgi:hypothetical protein